MNSRIWEILSCLNEYATIDHPRRTLHGMVEKFGFIDKISPKEPDPSSPLSQRGSELSSSMVILFPNSPG